MPIESPLYDINECTDVVDIIITHLIKNRILINISIKMIFRVLMHK